MKHTEQYRIQVKKLVFLSNFSKISKFPVISSNGIALALKSCYFYSNRQFFMIKHQLVEGSPLKIGLKSVISLKLADFMKI